jgi:ComF family protein
VLGVHRLIRTVALAGELLLDCIAPRECAACANGAEGSAGFCTACRQQLLALAPDAGLVPGVPLIAPYAYAAPLSLALQRLKYGGRPELSAPLARLIVPHIGAALRDCHALVPIPLHPERLAERGYNQAALLARHLRISGRPPVAARLLMRVRNTSGQVGQARADRFQNVAGAFAVRKPERARGMRIALVDDVVTTGATAIACIRALRTVGADVCAVLALARTLGAPPRAHERNL